MSMFEIVCSNSPFSRQLINYQFNSCLVLHAGPIGTRNQKMRLPMDSSQCQESSGGLRISKRPPLGITFF